MNPILYYLCATGLTAFIVLGILVATKQAGMELTYTEVDESTGKDTVKVIRIGANEGDDVA